MVEIQSPLPVRSELAIGTDVGSHTHSAGVSAIVLQVCAALI